MITSDQELQQNTHPADGQQGGAPVLDGQVEHTERPNVNAMREVIETQSEYEVGKPIEEKAEEVKTEEKGVTVEKGNGGTQIIINIAGKKKAMSFSCQAAADVFVKEASAKFGSKFELVSAKKPTSYSVTRNSGGGYDWVCGKERGYGDTYEEAEEGAKAALGRKGKKKAGRPDQCPKCNSLEVYYTRSDGGQLDLTDPKTFDAADTVNCSDCGHKWPFRIIEFVSDKKASMDKFEVKFSFRGKKLARSFSTEAARKAFVDGMTKHASFAVEAASAVMEPTIEEGMSDSLTPAPEAEETVPSVAPVTPPETTTDADAVREIALRETGMEFHELNDHQQKVVLEMARNRFGSQKEAGFNAFIPAQVLRVIDPSLTQKLIDPTQSAIEGDPMDFDGMFDVGPLSMVPKSPSGGLIGNDVKPNPLSPDREENMIGPDFQETFSAHYDNPPAINVLAKKAAAGAELEQFTMFLKRVMGEVAATFIAAFKATSKMPMNKVPGVGELQLSQIEQQNYLSGFNTVNTGSRVKYLLDKLADNEIQEALNEAWAQAAVWHDSPKGGYVYEVFVRAENIDTDALTMTYKFVTGTKDGDDPQEEE